MSRAIIIKSGWIYRQKTRLQKRWKKQWLVLFQDGTLFFRPDSAATRHGKVWHLKRDCVHLWGEKHCHHLLPPAESTSTCLFEVLFVGNKRLTLCALSEVEAQHWMEVIDRSRMERNVFTSSRQSSMLAQIDEEEDNSKSTCCCIFRPGTRVSEVYYRPATQGTKSRKHKRRVSWNENITMIS